MASYLQDLAGDTYAVDMKAIDSAIHQIIITSVSHESGDRSLLAENRVTLRYIYERLSEDKN